MAITELLKSATQGILSEETLKDIETAFNNAVDDKVKIHVEKALTEQDNDYANKLKHLLNVVDKDHTKKLLKVVEAIDNNHANKLKKLVEKFNKELTGGAKLFKENMINNVSTYLEAYLDESIPVKKLNEAVKHKRAQVILNQIREMLGVDSIVAKKSVRSAIVDGKRQIDEANNRLEAVQKELQTYKEQFAYAKSQVVLEKNLTNVDGKKKEYLRKVFKGKSAAFINENFSYASNLFDKSETERLQTLKEEATNTSTVKSVDRPLIQESVIEENNNNFEMDDSYMNPYLNELRKF
jgi:hypothetical protein